MTDLEITRLCAEAMGYTVITQREGSIKLDYSAATVVAELATIYQPLHNDAQAMALVKRFGLQLSARGDAEPEKWLVAFGFNHISNYVGHHTESADLNRAICECVAKMQAAK